MDMNYHSYLKYSNEIHFLQVEQLPQHVALLSNLYLIEFMTD